MLTLDKKLLAVGYGGVAQRSSDGIQWDPVEDAGTRWLFDAAFGNGILASVGEGGSIATFVPSTGWVRCTSGTTESLRSVAFGLDTFVAVGDEGIILQSAPLVVPTSEVTLTGPIRSGDKFSFDLIGEVGQTYQIQTTSDFSTWTPVLTVTCQTSPMPCTISGQNLTWQAYRAQKP